MRLKAIVLSALTITSSLQARDKDGFTPLSDGKTLSGWNNPYPWGKIEIVNGEFHLTGDRKFFLVTDKKYADFIFEGDILLPKGIANSGFMFRAHAKPNKVFGYQAETAAVSRAMGELDLLPAVRAAGDGTILVADGTSCRHPIADGAGREAVHAARVLARAVASGSGGQA